MFEISDAEGNIVSRVNGSTSKGLHRVTWNLRCGATTSVGGGPLCAPGKFTVKPMIVKNGKSESLGEPVEFEVQSIIDPSLPIQDRQEVLAFLQNVSKAANAANALRSQLSDRVEELDSVLNVLNRSSAATAELVTQATSIKAKLSAFDLKVNGDANKQTYAVETEPTISGRLNNVLFGASNSTHGPSQTQREQYQIAIGQLSTVSEEFKTFVQAEFVPLREALDNAGVPWTKGRELPDNIN